MKNICYSGAILALTTLLLTGCEALQKEYMKITLREQDKVLTFGREAGLEKSVTFSSTTSWTASVQGDWLAVAPDSGNSGSNTITVTTLTANDGNDGRTTEITLTAGGDPATITVVQKGTESTDDPDPNNPDPDEPVVSDEKFITKIRLTGTEDPNDVSDFYIAYDENGNIVGTDRFDIDMEAGECIYYSHVSHTVTGSDGNEITVLTRNEWISTAEMQSEKSEYTSSILLDDNGNAVRQPYAVGDEDLWVEAAYNADNTLKTWIWAGKEYENQEIAARWENGNMVYFNEEDITYAPEYAAPETETGFDFGFLDNRITSSLDYYYRETKDLINVIDVPAGTNFKNRIVSNIGSLRNQGVEFSINAKAISTPDWKWDLGFNVAWNNNEITKLTAQDDASSIVLTGTVEGGTGTMIQAQGVNHPANSFYVYEQVYDQQGNPIEGLYVDRNGDGVINDEDRYFCHKPAADVTMGFTSKLVWKAWDFSFSLRASLNNYVYNSVEAGGSDCNPTSVYSFGALNNRPLMGVANNIQNLKDNTLLSDYFVQNASFMKCDNITLGYSFKKLFGAPIGGRVYAAVQNVFTITKYKGLDPEVEKGLDNNIYPRPLTTLIGLSLNF